MPSQVKSLKDGASSLPKIVYDAATNELVINDSQRMSPAALRKLW